MTKNDTKPNPNPNPRRVHSFVPDPDVAKLLTVARERGYKLGWLVNAALRKHIPNKLR